jgi:hypothetical protein
MRRLPLAALTALTICVAGSSAAMAQAPAVPPPASPIPGVQPGEVANVHWRRLDADWQRSGRDLVKRRWDRLTETDLNYINGDRARLVLALQKHYILSGDEAEQQVAEFERGLH